MVTLSEPLINTMMYDIKLEDTEGTSFIHQIKLMSFKQQKYKKVRNLHGSIN
jgi:hypothetical protein